MGKRACDPDTAARSNAGRWLPNGAPASASASQTVVVVTYHHACRSIGPTRTHGPAVPPTSARPDSPRRLTGLPFVPGTMALPFPCGLIRTMSQTMTVTDAKARLSELVAKVASTQDHIDITRNGEPCSGPGVPCRTGRSARDHRDPVRFARRRGHPSGRGSHRRGQYHDGRRPARGDAGATYLHCVTDRWTVELPGPARPALEGELPPAVAWAAYSFISERLPTNPHRLGGLLTAPYDGCRSAHLGTYRVVYRIDDATSTRSTSSRFGCEATPAASAESPTHGQFGVVGVMDRELTPTTPISGHQHRPGSPRRLAALSSADLDD